MTERKALINKVASYDRNNGCCNTPGIIKVFTTPRITT
jgi:hypothetical protein